jgi:hypothetical protein
MHAEQIDRVRHDQGGPPPPSHCAALGYRGAHCVSWSCALRPGEDAPECAERRTVIDQIHAAEAQPPGVPGTGPAVSRASLQADLLAAQERAARLAARVRQLEHRLSELLGQQPWRESGLGAPADIDALNQKITYLEQHAADLRLQLEERGQDLDAARAANRELMA